MSECAKILAQGIYDIHEHREERDYVFSYLNWIKNHKIQTNQQAESFGIGVKIPIKKVMAEFNLTDDESSFSQAINYLETYESLSETDKSKINPSIRTANSEIIAAWDRCINSKGTHIWIEHTSDPRVFWLHAKYVGEGDEVKRWIKNISFEKEKISTEGGPFMDSSGKMTKETFTARKTQKFTRLTDDATDIIISPNKGEDKSYHFEAINADNFIWEVDGGNRKIFEDNYPRVGTSNVNSKPFRNTKNKNVRARLTVEFGLCCSPASVYLSISISYDGGATWNTKAETPNPISWNTPHTPYFEPTPLSFNFDIKAGQEVIFRASHGGPGHYGYNPSESSVKFIVEY